MSAISATQDKILKKLKRERPEIMHTIEQVHEAVNAVYEKSGMPKQPLSFGVIVTDDMTEEEEKMAHIEYYLKQGYSIDEAEKLAEDFMEKVKEIFDNPQRKT